MDDKERDEIRRFYIVDHDSDIPNEQIGSCIPAQKFHFRPRAVIHKIPVTNTLTGERYWIRLILMMSLLLMVVVTSVHTFLDPTQLLARVFDARPQPLPPTIIIEHPYTQQRQELTFGVQTSFTEPLFISEVRDAFIESNQSFIEIDIVTRRVNIYENGTQLFSFPIIAIAERGSWAEVPAGLYRVENIQERYYSVLGQIELPYFIGFQGNLGIHGTPTAGYDTEEETIGERGVIRLADSAAITIKGFAKKGMPILVFGPPVPKDSFVYEPSIPDVPSPHYMVADVMSSTVLASSALDDQAVIASLTKLMTALVAAEQLNLDHTVRVLEPTFVQSLIPRLQYRESVSLYSLMQLLLIESSNEAAEVIASQIGREKFISMMNNRAASLGMTNTTFVDPSGIGAGNVSTLRDLFRLTQYIYQTRSFILELSANQDLPTTFVGGEFGRLSNFNEIAGDDTFIGGKIGETRAAGQTSVTLHQIRVRGEDRIIAIIILGSESRNADVTLLLEYLRQRFVS
jgi:D-alanyl-D-alanine carboxypeptidase